MKLLEFLFLGYILLIIVDSILYVFYLPKHFKRCFNDYINNRFPFGGIYMSLIYLFRK